jgi:hypothetical protein
LKLLRKRPKSFEIQVQDMALHITAGGSDLYEESRASALSFWEQIQSYALRNPDFRQSKRPLQVPENAPEIVKEIVTASSAAGVGPMFAFRGALTDHVGRFLSRSVSEVSVSCAGDHFIVTKKRKKLTVHPGSTVRELAVVVQPLPGGVGISTGVERGRAIDGLAVLAESCMLADAAAAAVQAIVGKPDGFRSALIYLRRVPGVFGGVLIHGDRIGMAGGVEIAA